MTQHFLRRKWMPSDEDGLLAAFNDGLLEEKNWCDLKRELSPGKNANAELARDLASFAMYGGTLIIGLDERCPGGSPLSPVDLSAVTQERIEQVADMKVDPPLTVECSVIKAPSKPGAGYVLVHVPESPLAPHQVEGKYMGRGDKTKRYLADAEVAGLMRRRQLSTEVAAQALAALVQTDPFADFQNHAHLFLLARPVRHDTEMLRPLIEDPRRLHKVAEMLNKIRAMPEIRALPPYTGFRLESQLLGHSTRTADGFKVGPAELDTTNRERREKWALSLEMCEDGTLRFYDLHVSSGPNRSGTRTPELLFLDQILTTCRQFLALAVELSDSAGFAGNWQLGVALTRVYGMQAADFHGAGPQSLEPAVYTGREYRNMTGAAVRELQERPGRVAERLLGRLVRSLAAGTPDAFVDQPSGSSPSVS
jgi:hypothetical protein